MMYRKKQVTIEARQWDGDVNSATDLIDWILSEGERAHYRCKGEECSHTPEGHDLIIETLEGEMRVSPGDYVIQGVVGEFYPCKPEIFAQTYEKVDE